MIAFGPITPGADGYDALERESIREGHGMLRRLRENWLEGTNRFSKPGEILLGAFDGAILLGVCGRNVDPYGNDPRAGRVRHLYVAPSFRRLGVGRALMSAITEDAGKAFDHLNTRAPEAAFGFYEHLGFVRIENDPFVTHRLNLLPRAPLNT